MCGGTGKLESTEKILDFIKLLTMNEDQYCCELTSLSAKVSNFLDDREIMLSGQLLTVMYAILTEHNEKEAVGGGTNGILVTL